MEFPLFGPKLLLGSSLLDEIYTASVPKTQILGPLLLMMQANNMHFNMTKYNVHKGRKKTGQSGGTEEKKP